MSRIIREEISKKPYARRTADPKFEDLKPGYAIADVDKATASALLSFGKKRGWRMSQRLQADGSYKVGRSV